MNNLYFFRTFVRLKDYKMMKKGNFKYPKVYLYAASIGAAAIIALVCYYLSASLSASEEAQYVYIDTDDTIDSVYAKLEPFATTVGKKAFHTISRHSKYANNIHTGRYRIEPGDGALTVWRQLSRGQQEPINLTVPEARTTDRLAALLSKKLMIDSTTIAQALKDSIFCAKYEADTATIVCLFIPNTYNIYWDTTLADLMLRMQREHNDFWTPDRRKKAEAIGLTPDEVQTLASIVDEETNNVEEKHIIAGLYLNRLKKDMPLQACPTIKFAWKRFDLKRLYDRLLSIDSPYNTYRYKGLPPGPIKVASIKGIDAVLNYTPSDYLFMCAKDDFSGHHAFAANGQEHMANARRYQHALNERGIK